MKTIVLLMVMFLTNNTAFGQFEICNSSTTKSLWDVWFVDENVGFAVGDSGAIIRSHDGGLNWDLIMSNDTINLKKVKFFDSMNGITIGTDVLKTTDGGLTWTFLDLPSEYFIDIEITNDSTCFVSGLPNRLMKSSDKGLTWSILIDENANEKLGLLSFVDENIGYSCPHGSPTNEIYKTIDSGVSWTTINVESGIYNSVVEALSFISENTGFKAGWYNPLLTKTTDYGVNWEFVSYADSNFSGQINDFHIEQNQPNAYYACGWHNTLAKSIDGGENWSTLSPGIPTNEHFYGIFFIDESNGWVVGTNGTILKTTNGGGTVGIKEVLDFLAINVFPNPVNDVLNLEINSELTGTFDLRIYNPFGQLVKSNRVELTIGENTAIINVNDLPKGSYLLQMTDGEKMTSRKFMKM